MNSRTLYLLLISASFHAFASAQVFKCKSADGRNIFQEVPCAAGTTDANPRRKPAATEESVVLPKKDNKPGANWDLGPRPTIPSPPSPVATPIQATLPMPPPVAREQRQTKQSELERQQAEQRKAEDEKAAAFNRMQRCNYARQQLGVTKTERPIYSYNNKGERQYVSDENRQATITAAERRVAEECN